MRRKQNLRATQNNIDTGFLQINAISETNQIPVKNATIQIASTGNPEKIIDVLETDADGKTPNISLTPRADSK